MRSWERKDITDILIKHHEELRDTSVELSLRGGVGDFAKAQKVDDDCIVIEDFLHESFGMDWQGDHFHDSHGNTV